MDWFRIILLVLPNNTMNDICTTKAKEIRNLNWNERIFHKR